MKFMSQADWDEYTKVLNDWQEDAFQQPIIWRKMIVTSDIHGEDHNQRYQDIPLKCLIQYNHFRSWPITKIDQSGEIDKESMMAFFNVKWLQDNGYANDKGQFLFQSDYDRFIVNDVEYKAMGESQAGQAHDKPLFFFIILKREEIETGEEEYGNQ